MCIRDRYMGMKKNGLLGSLPIFDSITSPYKNPSPSKEVLHTSVELVTERLSELVRERASDDYRGEYQNLLDENLPFFIGALIEEESKKPSSIEQSTKNLLSKARDFEAKVRKTARQTNFLNLYT
eukprot:TRINITY_DN15141_c0_g1_i1.p1 TRINITY_DN15141_c0_g1~~TRINITY_DN15141_c0_g1_i1.p1  ORF type:complete len:144 (-),score=48.91 TRINITY_DN15141_c0_g1_i1:4-378(-)